MTDHHQVDREQVHVDVLVNGQPVGALMLTTRAAAGDLWLPDGTRVALTEVVRVALNKPLNGTPNEETTSDEPTHS